MHPIYKSCYPLDKRCYDEFNLTEDILMENASLGMANYIRSHFEQGSSLLIVAGVGNNGADGIVLSRLLMGYCNTKLYLSSTPKSDMAIVQLDRVQRLGIEIVDSLVDADIIIDAIFGAGLSRELNDSTQKLIYQLNNLRGFKIACDIPTGITADGNPSPIAFRADVTITMGALKESLYSDNAKDFVGKIVCVDLGIDREIYEIKSDSYLLERADIKTPVRYRETTHKGIFGHLSLICNKKEGATILSAMASLRFGVGLSTIVGEPKSSLPYSLMQSKELPYNTTAIALGMGYGYEFDHPIIDEILHHTSPLLLDADIFHNDIIVKFLEQSDRDIVITPHPKEFISLWGRVMDSHITIEQLQSDRFGKCREFSSRYPHITLLLKGSNMIISKDKRLFVNPYGSAKLSKGGSGDVLSGLISALLAQGYSAVDATVSGSLALTSASELYSGSSYSMLPTDLIDLLEFLQN